MHVSEGSIVQVIKSYKPEVRDKWYNYSACMQRAGVPFIGIYYIIINFTSLYWRAYTKGLDCQGIYPKLYIRYEYLNVIIKHWYLLSSV